MPGFSITLLLLPSNHESPSSALVLSLLGEDTDAPAWKRSLNTPPLAVARATPAAVAEQPKRPTRLAFPDPQAFTAAIERACKQLISAEPEITRMDSIAGDGDCGLTLRAGASGALHSLLNIFSNTVASLWERISSRFAHDSSLHGMTTISDYVIRPLTFAWLAAVLKQVSDGNIEGNDVVSAVISIAKVAEEEMGGTSGALYSYVPS